MTIVKSRRALVWAAAVVAALVLAGGGTFFSPAANITAHQPDGLRISHTEMPEPPCPYGHDDACETAAPPLPLRSYLSSDPHDRLPDISAGRHDHHEDQESIAALNQKVLARLAGSGDAINQRVDTRLAGSGDVGKETDRKPGAPGGGVSYAITSDITGLPWVLDGQTTAEKLTIAWLSELQEHNPSLVTTLVGMPFLQDHTPGDLQAIQTLTWISSGTSRTPANPQYAMNLVNRPALADGGGIDNTEAKLIAVTSIPYFDGDTALVELIANFGTVEEWSGYGQRGNRLSVGIVRLLTHKQNSALMQSVTSATRHAETLMGKALPVDFVGILVDDSPYFSGANNGIHIQMDSGFDSGYYSDRARQLTVAHEIGHYWWGTGEGYLHENWISEGAASYIGAYSEKTQFGDSGLFTNYWPCPYYRTIEHLRADNPHYSVSQGSLCNYSLGERLFIDLDRNMGHMAFATGFRNLHQRLSTYEVDEIDQGLSLTRAFCAHCLTPNSRPGDAGYTLARWYGEMILTDRSAPTGTITGLGSSPSVSLRGYGHDNRQYGIPEISASSPDQRRWLQVYFSDATNPPETVRVAVQQYHEERHPHYSYWQDRPVYQSESDPAAWFHVYLGDPDRRAPGHHWVYVYNEQGQKIAEAEYQVVP